MVTSVSSQLLTHLFYLLAAILWRYWMLKIYHKQFFPLPFLHSHSGLITQFVKDTLPPGRIIYYYICQRHVVRMNCHLALRNCPIRMDFHVSQLWGMSKPKTKRSITRNTCHVFRWWLVDTEVKNSTATYVIIHPFMRQHVPFCLVEVIAGDIWEWSSRVWKIYTLFFVIQTINYCKNTFIFFILQTLFQGLTFVCRHVLGVG